MNYQRVTIPVKILERDLPPIPEVGNSYFSQKITTDWLTPEFKKYLLSKGLSTTLYSSLILFYAFPNTRISVHTDGGGEHAWALNIPLSEGTIEMQWYKPTEVGTVITRGELTYEHFPEDSPMVDNVLLTSPTLCRNGIPHSSANNGQGAWLLSVRAWPYPLQFSKLVKRFNDSAV